MDDDIATMHSYYKATIVPPTKGNRENFAANALESRYDCRHWVFKVEIYVSR